jgi:hypothetical protein
LIDNSYCNYCGKIGTVTVPIRVDSIPQGSVYAYKLTVGDGYKPLSRIDFSVRTLKPRDWDDDKKVIDFLLSGGSGLGTFLDIVLDKCRYGSHHKEPTISIPAGASEQWGGVSCSGPYIISHTYPAYPSVSFTKNGKNYKYCNGSVRSGGYDFYCHKTDI